MPPTERRDGAGAEIRHALGTTVFAGMLGVTFFGPLLTPVLYGLVRRLTDRNKVKLSPRERTDMSQLAASAAKGSHG